jgi:hypothetical protein
MDTNAPRCYGGALFYKGKIGVIISIIHYIPHYTSIFPNFNQSGNLEFAPKKSKSWAM